MPQDSPVPQYPSHRPRYKGHDYYERGIYLITIVIAHRDPLFGSLNMDPVHPGVDLTPLGRAVEEEWVATPSIQAEHGRSVKNLGHIVMPDHFHGVLFVEERMDISVGRIIRGFKVACTQRWRLLQGQPSLVDTPTEGNNGAPNQGNNGAPNQGNNEAPNQGNNEAPNQGNNGAPNGAPEGPLTPDGRPLSAMSHAQRARYYASLPRNQQPLFDDNYDDSVLYAPNQLEAMLAYVKDNPRRAILKARVPQFMQCCRRALLGLRQLPPAAQAAEGAGVLPSYGTYGAAHPRRAPRKWLHRPPLSARHALQGSLHRHPGVAA